MKNLKKLKDDELEKLVEKDDHYALLEKGRRLLKEDNLKEARRFLTFSSVLGNVSAHISLAKILEEEDNFEGAYDLYSLAYSKGEDSVLPKLARLIMINDKKLGIEVLKASANDGHIGCIKELIKYYKEFKSKEHEKDIDFWQAKLTDARE